MSDYQFTISSFACIETKERSNNMPSNFDFLREEFPVLADFGGLAERYCYSDPNSCLMKLGMIGETIVNLMFAYDKLPLPFDQTAASKIDILFREGLIDRELCDILHSLRKVRNKAAHENYASVSDAKSLLQMAHSLCEWFMQTYGDWNYQHHNFVMPQNKMRSSKIGTQRMKEMPISPNRHKTRHNLHWLFPFLNAKNVQSEQQVNGRNRKQKRAI